MDFAAIKSVHMICAGVTYALFFMRGVWMINGSPNLQRRWVRVAPHLVDTVLLASAVAMAAVIWSRLADHAWLYAKMIGLAAYIGLGTLALKRGRTRRVRIAAWLAAQAVFFYIVAVAITRNPLPWLA